MLISYSKNHGILFKRYHDKKIWIYTATKATYGTLAAQVVMEGGSSDDSFYYFRCWLISLGKKNFYRVIENPDYLAAMDVPMSSIYRSYHCRFEELLSRPEIA